uniref:Bm8154 n=1 Tax=Brugia malayi TaxID=6279 RepID=A0A0H5SDT6_BRUMA|nr:Bm8154 [Brugia malayi]
MTASEGEGSYGAMLSSFTTSVKADLDSPVTSNFGNRIAEYRVEAQRIVEETEGYTVDFERLRKASKEVEDTLVILVRQLLAFGQAAKEIATKWTSRSESQYESDVAVILMKMECHIKDEADLTNLQMRNWQSNIVTPFLTLVEIGREIRNRGVERSCRDYENKYVKAEADARKHAKHAGYTRSQLGHGELAEQLTRERLMVQYELCKFLMSVDTVEDRRGPQLLRHFMELVRNQNSYYMNRVRVNEDFRQDMTKLEERMMTRNANRCAQRNTLWDLKGQLEANDELARCASGRRSSGRDSVNLGSRLSGINLVNASSALLNDNDPLNELATSTAFFPDLDFTQSGYLYKKSNKKLHKQWQKRRCRIEDGHFWLSHSDESAPPTKLSLLVSDCKPSTDDPKSFDLYCRERTYHLQADSETDAKRWMLALKREITRVKAKMLSAETPQGNEGGSSGAISELYERKMCVAKVRKLPGNNVCADCSSKEDVQWLSNIGALVCIACSGVHRELGVHVSRIQSLNLDVISPLEFLVPLSSGNIMINRLFEYDAAKCATWKPIPGCTRFDRQRFIQMKYRDRTFVQELDDPDASLTEAFNNCDFENTYRALLSPNLTKKPFFRNGPFHQMVLRETSLSLPLADLVMQLRIEISDMEAIIMDCIRCGNADMVAVLLRYRSLSSAVRSIHLHSLITCSENAQQKKITETLRSLQLGDSTQVQNVAVPPILFISTPDSASLSRSSSSVSSCPHLPSDSTASQNVISKPINVLMRNGTTISVPQSPLSMEDTGGNRLSKQIFVESEPAHSLVERETSAHNSTQTSGSKNFDERKEFLPFVVPLCTSTPSSNVDSARVVTHSNHYSVTLPSIPISSSPPISVTPAQNMAKSYIRSASEYSRTANSFEDPGDRSATVRSLPGHLAPQSSSTRDNDEIMGATFPIVASISLDPIPLNAQKQEMNIYVVAPGKEEIIDKEKCVAEAQNERERLARNPYTTNEQDFVKGTSSAFDQARSNFTSDNEHARFSLMNSLAANNLRREMPRYMSRSIRLTRPAPAPPPLIGVKLKPPIPAPRRFPSLSRENKQRDCARRCRALYDCKADNADELSFRQGDIIVITKEKITGESDIWMEGYLENNPLCKGVFPTTFVTFLS